MSELDGYQKEVAAILFGLSEAKDYALAGGAALVAHDVIDRPTRDLDAFVEAQPETPPGDVTHLLHALAANLERNGWTVTIIREHQTFARMLAKKDAVAVEVDLAVDSPRLFPAQVAAGLPALSQPDLAARKILAILDRAEGRDFTDLHALQRIYTRRACVGWAQQLDAGLTSKSIADAFANLDRLEDGELPTPSPRQVRQLFSVWAEELQGL